MSASPTGTGGRARGAGAWLLWLAVLVAATLALVPVRAALDRTYVALAYLLVVLGGSAQRGRLLGLALSALAFASFNLFFVPPYGTFVVADPVDWLALLAFLATSTVATQLLSRAQHETAIAHERTAEVDRLAALGAESINAARADDALGSIAAVIRDALGVSESEIRVSDEHGDVVPAHLAGAPLDAPAPTDLAAWVMRHGRAAAVRVDGTAFVASGGSASGEALAGIGPASEVRTLHLPLRVRDRTVGTLRLASDTVISLTPTRRRVLTALTYYAALGAERVRLARVAEQAVALREADRVKDGLLASVSHDLRTPLTTIKALAHEMAVGGDERAAVIVEEADRLTRLVTDLLDLSRLQGGVLRVVAEIVAVDDVVGAAIQRLSGMPGSDRLRVTLDAAGPLLAGRLDFVHTLRILVNLVENALKYAPAASAVELSVLRDGGDVVFAVADRGPGVPAEERERIFVPFYRPPGAPPDVAGAGLGLSIARGLALAQGGSLGIAPRDGGGSVFTLRLPAADLAAGAFGDAGIG